jgi:O-antigen/teichoic acid export membrane protein
VNWAFLRRYVLAFGEQGLTALLSLFVALWLIRRGGPEEFGAYVFWASASFVVSTFAASLTSVHLHKLRPAPLAGRRNVERALLAANILLAGLAAILTLGVLPLLGAPLGLWGAALLVPGTLIGIYARTLATSRARLEPALGISLVVALAVVGGLGAGAALGVATTANQVLVLTGLAQGGAGAWVLARLSAGMRPDWAGRRWRALLRRSVWPLAGGMANEVATRLYVFLVAAWAGTAAMSALAAAQTLLRPATLVAGAWGGAARSALARLRHAEDHAGFARLVALGAIGPALVTLLLGAGLALFWPFVSAHLYGGRYAELAPVVLLWTVTMAIACFGFVFGVALQALGRLDAAARSDIAAAAVIAAAMPAALLLLPPPGALLAMILGGLVQVAIQYGALKAALHGRRSPLQAG